KTNFTPSQLASGQTPVRIVLYDHTVPTCRIRLRTIRGFAIRIELIQRHSGFAWCWNSRSKTNRKAVVQHGIGSTLGANIMNKQDLSVRRISDGASSAAIISKAAVTRRIARVLDPEIRYPGFTWMSSIVYSDYPSRKVAAGNSSARRRAIP